MGQLVVAAARVKQLRGNGVGPAGIVREFLEIIPTSTRACSRGERYAIGEGTPINILCLHNRLIIKHPVTVRRGKYRHLERIMRYDNSLDM